MAVRLPSCLLLLSDWCKHEGSLTAISQKVTIHTREASLPSVRK
jgi:hypothetical protein